MGPTNACKERKGERFEKEGPSSLLERSQSLREEVGTGKIAQEEEYCFWQERRARGSPARGP